MAHPNKPTSGMQLASPPPATARRPITLAAVARPAGEVVGLLLVEILRSPRARSAVLSLA
jgi:hypothetical protein